MAKDMIFVCSQCNRYCKTEIRRELKTFNMEKIKDFINNHTYAHFESPQFYMIEDEFKYEHAGYDIGDQCIFEDDLEIKYDN